ncbi:hypothetical protein DERP_003980 [Dermatophagoides pteronyssinus]|uniref:Uncharacterized protein n=1 Tax=Dermatophagoides pteronyssinus TaxID=6956 RepID=A0ABQ8J7T0_DERPT|nr:hypothetical protein DERP_003980 [Dermatophagoides pteronyssinus]
MDEWKNSDNKNLFQTFSLLFARNIIVIFFVVVVVVTVILRKYRWTDSFLAIEHGVEDHGIKAPETTELEKSFSFNYNFTIKFDDQMTMACRFILFDNDEDDNE